jgi:hypothetical protein
VGEDDGVQTSWGGDDQTITIQSVANFIFHVTAFVLSLKHTSDHLYFLYLHNTNGGKARIQAGSGLRLSDRLSFARSAGAAGRA